MDRTVYLDGMYVPESAALFPPTDLGLLYGLGSFETVRLYRGRAFLADRHEARMRDALARLAIVPPPFRMGEIFEELSRRNDLPDARGRLIATGGTEHPEGIDATPRIFAEVLPLAPAGAQPGTQPADGVRVLVWHPDRDGVTSVTGIKSLAYLANFLARRAARQSNANEAILCAPDGELLEGATSNFFLAMEGALLTPPADGRLLPGVTRGVVIEEAHRLGVPVRERRLHLADLGGVDEAFLTSTMREVLPIADFGGRPLRAPGPLTARLRDAYRGRVEAFLTSHPKTNPDPD